MLPPRERTSLGWDGKVEQHQLDNRAPAEKLRCSILTPHFSTPKMTASPPPPRPATMAEMDQRTIPAWFVSFSAAMAPFTALCYGHSRGLTARVVDRVVRSPVGVYGLFALPFVTLGMEKSIYDTVQAWQGLDPNVRPADRGGFPSGGAGEDFAVHFTRPTGRRRCVCTGLFLLMAQPLLFSISCQKCNGTQSCHRSA